MSLPKIQKIQLTIPPHCGLIIVNICIMKICYYISEYKSKSVEENE